MEIKDHTLIDWKEQGSTIFGLDIYSLVHKKDGKLYGCVGDGIRQIDKFETNCYVVKYDAGDKDLFALDKKYKDSHTVAVCTCTSDESWDKLKAKL